MKNIKLLFILFIGLAIIGTSCKKAEEETTEDLLNELLDVKGSINLSIAGNTYDKLFSSVIFSESDQMVTFWAYDLDSDASFLVSFGEVPAVGSTGTIDFENDDSMVFIITGSLLEGGGFYAESGTIKRTSTDNYTINVVVNDYTQTGSAITISGSVVVGKNNP